MRKAGSAQSCGGRGRPLFWTSREGDVWGDVHGRPDRCGHARFLGADSKRRMRARPIHRSFYAGNIVPGFLSRHFRFFSLMAMS